MIFKKTTRTQPETVFMVVQNVSGSTMTAGYSMVLDIGASVDGVRCTQADTVDLGAFIGVADRDIANNAYGLAQVYGYRSSVYIYSSTGSSAGGDLLAPTNGEWGLTPAATSGTAKAFAFLCEAITASSSSQFHTTAKAFIRAL